MNKYKINTNLIVEIIDQKITIFDPEKSTLYTLNDMGSLIFSLIKKGNTETKIVQKILNSFNCTENKAEKDVQSILKQLEKNQVIFSSD